MATLYLNPHPEGAFKVGSPSNHEIPFPVSDPEYNSSLFSDEILITINGHFSGGREVKMLHYHPGKYSSLGRLGLSFIDLLTRAGLLIAASRVNPKYAAAALATKSGLYFFRDADEAFKHYSNSDRFPEEGYYADDECVIKGKITRADVHPR